MTDSLRDGGGAAKHPFPLRRDVFAAMDEIERNVRVYRERIEEMDFLDPMYAMWLAERVLNVIQTIKDANVTYGIVGDDAELLTPMMVERDAIVGALDA